MTKSETNAVLVFENTEFDVVDIHNAPWLRGAQVALALGYQNPANAIKDLFSRNVPIDLYAIPWHSCRTVPNTPPKAVSAPVRQSGFFTSIGFSMAGSAQSCNSLRAKAASGSLGRVEVPATPQQGGLFNEPKGGHHG